MESPYLIFGILVFIAGCFLAIAMSIQLYACVKTFRKMQRERARLREIKEAAAQPPPPYALVVSSCHLNHSRNTDLAQQNNPPCSTSPCTGSNNVCCIIGPICQHHHQRSNPNLSSCQPHNIITLANPSSISTICCYCGQHSDLHVMEGGECTSNNCHKAFYTNPLEIYESSERLPTYEEAVKIEMTVAK